MANKKEKLVLTGYGRLDNALDFVPYNHNELLAVSYFHNHGMYRWINGNNTLAAVKPLTLNLDLKYKTIYEQTKSMTKQQKRQLIRQALSLPAIQDNIDTFVKGFGKQAEFVLVYEEPTEDGSIETHKLSGGIDPLELIKECVYLNIGEYIANIEVYNVPKRDRYNDMTRMLDVIIERIKILVSIICINKIQKDNTSTYLETYNHIYMQEPDELTDFVRHINRIIYKYAKANNIKIVDVFNMQIKRISKCAS